MIEQFSLAELVAVAVFFFLLAVILMLAALRLAGYLGGEQETHRHDELELMRWLDRVGMSYRELDTGNNGTAIMLCIANSYVYFFFNERGELIGDDAQSSL